MNELICLARLDLGIAVLTGVFAGAALMFIGLVLAALLQRPGIEQPRE